MDYLEDVSFVEVIVGNIGLYVAYGFGAAIMVGLLVWGVSVVVNLFRNIIRG